MASAAEQLASNLNFAAFAKAEDLKKRIWFTLGALLVYRLGTYIPLPGINPDAFAQAFQQQSGGVLGMFNMFAGGAVERMAIFALGIMPYISASIIMQLMTSVIPSLEEGFGIPAAEAMGCEVPVVATDAGGLPEVVEHGVTGLVVPRGDSGALAKAIGSLLDDPDRRREMGQAGLARALRLFDWDRSAEQFEQLYREVAARMPR